MFTKKVRRSWLNATDSFLTEMLRAILKEMTGVEVYLTQVSFKAQKARKPREFETWNEWQYVNLVLEVEVSAFFTALDFPRRHGREGVFPVLPEATAKFVLVNEVSGWYNWKLASAEVNVVNFFTSLVKDDVKLAFGGGGDWFEKASNNLCVLAEELQYRGPSRLSVEE